MRFLESHLDVHTAALALESTPSAIRLGIVAPDGRDGMLIHAQQFVDAKIPFIFDPGQGLPMFDSKDLNTFIEQATYIAVNDYEGEMLSHKTGLPLLEIAKRVKALIVTKGIEGSEIYVDGQVIRIPVVSVEKPIDPTGCGDAFRAGLLYGIENQLDMETTGRLGSLMGAMKIACQGPQNHTPSFELIQELYRQAFQSDFA